MHSFRYHQGQLFAENVPLQPLAVQHGTPLYVYSRAAMRHALDAYSEALAGREHILAAYREAVAQGYRFFSYGDAMAIVTRS